MKTIYDIAKTELKTLFYSPVAWLVLLILTIQVTMPFIGAIGNFVDSKILGVYVDKLTNELFTGSHGFLPDVLKYAYLYVPLLTMGLVSRELNTGSIKLLLSSPISSRQIVFGKFLAMMIYSFILIIPIILLTSFSFVIVKDFDITFVISGIIGIYLLLCAYSAIGLFMSSLTSYQVVAAMGTLAVLGFLNFIGTVGQGIDFVRDITYWLSIAGRANLMVKGLISSDGILYFVTVIGMFLSLTIIRFNSGKIKNKLIIAGRYTCAIVAALLIGYISSRPIMKVYVDMTATKMRTLTPNSQKIVAKLDGKLTVTTYVNLLDRKAHFGMPKAVNHDKKKLQQYIRFKPDTKIKYVYYWDKSYDPYIYNRYKGLSDEEIARKICKVRGYDFEDFLRPEEIRKIIDLSPEKNKFVRLIERENGQRTWLRLFDDLHVHPEEPEISAALNRMLIVAPKVGFLTGHKERDVFGFGDRDYGNSACSKTFRNSLFNQGFDFDTVNLATSEVPKDINILVIADMRHELSAEENARLDKYIARGGNLLIAAEPKRRKAMGKLIDKFGVKFTKGLMTQENKGGDPTLIAASFTPDGASNTSYIFDKIKRMRKVVTMPRALSLNTENSVSKGFEDLPLLVSPATKSWNEVETKDFIDEKVQLNESIGEEEKAHTMGVALTRFVNNEEQRILILGDADCISNGEISTRHSGMRAANFDFFTGIFEWLSMGEMPIDTRRPPLTDNDIYLGKVGYMFWNGIFLWLIPLGLILSYLFLWIRRRKK